MMHREMARAVRTATLLCAAACALNANAAPPLPDLDALVSYETRQVMASGVTRVDSWQERLVRRGSQVWVERILPPASRAGHERESEAEHLGHKHFNGDTAARWIAQTADGKIELRFVDREHKAVVSVPRAEYTTVGFDGSFEGAASVVPPTVVRAMRTPAGASVDPQWRTDRSNGWSHRVLWSESRQLALKVESQREDGSVRRVVSVQLLPTVPGHAVPWGGLAGYTQKRYDDFMD